MDSLVSSKRKPLSPEVGRLRSVKSKVEQDIMRQAADISARAHNKVRHRLCLPSAQHADSDWTVVDHALYGSRRFRTYCRCSLRISLCARGLAASGLCACSRFRVRRYTTSFIALLWPLTRVCAYRPNALVIHYTSNSQLIADGEMVLIDAGCEYK